MTRGDSKVRVAIIGAGFLTGWLAAMSLMAAPTFAAGPYWRVTTTVTPTNLPPGGEGKIVIVATNSGDASAEGASSPINVADRLPAGVTATGIESRTFSQGAIRQEAMTCTLSPTANCSWPETVTPYGVMQLTLTVKVEEPPGIEISLPNEVTVTGGGAPETVSNQSLAVNGKAVPFGFERFQLTPENENGSLDTQAGSHPFQLTTTLSLNTTLESGLVRPAGLPKDVFVNLPPGLIGDPNAVPQCTYEQFTTGANFSNLCPADTAVGVVSVTLSDLSTPGGLRPITEPEPLFNLKPAPGEPARLGFQAAVVPIVLDTAVRTGRDYGVTVSSNNILQTAGLVSSRVTVWGVPGDPRHDGSRGWGCLQPLNHVGTCVPSSLLNPTAFLSLPTSCGSPPETSVEADSWSAPGKASEVAAPIRQALGDSNGQLLALEGCNRLPFTPTLSVQPEGRAASTPTGLHVDLSMPQETTLTANGLAEADVKDTTVALPQGMQLNPSSANGLEACSEAQVGFQSIDSGGTNLFSAAVTEPFCPNPSKVGVVRIKTPLLAHELEGGVYLAAQDANPFGSLVALYIVAQDPVSGVLVKLAGEVKLDEHTGQIVSTFDNTPQQPFEDLKLEFFGGERGAVSTPALCGTYETKASLTPSSGTPPVQSSSNFPTTSGPNGTSCADPQPFSPSLTAGSTDIQAAAFTPFTLAMSRQDGQQNLAGVTLHMAPGLLGKLASVTPCREPQAAQGTCGPDSLIGNTVVSVGLGSDPYTVPGGKVFITGPYKGGPYGLSIAEPAKAGPFDLGSGPCDCVVVRSKIEVDPYTAELTVTSDPLPTMLQGIPLQIKRVNVTVDRPGFTFNPTNCSQLAITATLSGEQGASAPAAVPFEVANCASLPFKPSFTVSTQGKTSKANGASLDVKVAERPGEANIHKVNTQLPLALPSRLTTLQKACGEAQFTANPAGCPAGSNVGMVTAHTPVLKSPLVGPAYLVSHGGAAFPDLDIVLQGEGITIDLTGNTDIKKGITFSRFETVPDAPISTFELVLPEGPHSVLAAVGNLCEKSLVMPTTITGQNGAHVTQSTKISVTGCPPTVKVKKARVNGNLLLVTVTTTQKGAVTVSGTGLRTTRKTVGAGTHVVKVPLTRIGKVDRKHHKKTTMKVSAKNTHGSTSTTTSIRL